MSRMVGIIESGMVGQVPGAGFAEHGYDVMLGSRTAAKQEELRREMKKDSSICDGSTVTHASIAFKVLRK